MATEAHIARVFVDDCIAQARTPASSTPSTAVDGEVVDHRAAEASSSTQGVQLHGGYGYMMEYPIAKAFVDSRVQTIYGGTTEIQKEIIGRSLGI